MEELDQKNPVFPDELPENSQNLTNHDDEIQTLEAADPINPYTRISLARDNTNVPVEVYPLAARYRYVFPANDNSTITATSNIIRVVTIGDASDKDNRIRILATGMAYHTLIPNTVEYFSVTPGDQINIIVGSTSTAYITMP